MIDEWESQLAASRRVGGVAARALRTAAAALERGVTTAELDRTGEGAFVRPPGDPAGA